LNLLTDFDLKILHLPVLWERYHDELIAGKFGVGSSFWIGMIRTATHTRLEVARGEKQDHHRLGDAYSGWDHDYIEAQRDIWNEDVLMDHYTKGEWQGGKEYWSQFAVL
jgi:hypothetical protein